MKTITYMRKNQKKPFFILIILTLILSTNLLAQEPKPKPKVLSNSDFGVPTTEDLQEYKIKVAKLRDTRIRNQWEVRGCLSNKYKSTRLATNRNPSLNNNSYGTLTLGEIERLEKQENFGNVLCQARIEYFADGNKKVYFQTVDVGNTDIMFKILDLIEKNSTKNSYDLPENKPLTVTLSKNLGGYIYVNLEEELIFAITTSTVAIGQITIKSRKDIPKIKQFLNEITTDLANINEATTFEQQDCCTNYF